MSDKDNDGQRRRSTVCGYELLDRVYPVVNQVFRRTALQQGRNRKLSMAVFFCILVSYT